VRQPERCERGSDHSRRAANHPDPSESEGGEWTDAAGHSGPEELADTGQQRCVSASFSFKSINKYITKNFNFVQLHYQL